MRASPALVSPSAPAVQPASSPKSPQSVTPSSTVHETAIAPVISSITTLTLPAIPTISNANNMVTSKPSRPYTEYTMFYQLEREFIIHRVLASNDDPSAMAESSKQPALFQNDPLMPARYRSLPLRADWYISGKTKKPTKRKHRKTHGKIGFLELTRMIAARWATVDDETRKYCKMMAAMELVKYKEDMDSYNMYKEQLSKVGEIPEDMKERMIKKQRVAEKKDAGAATAAARGREKSGATPTSTPTAPPVITADIIQSSREVIAIEPLTYDALQRVASNFDDMEQFISSLVSSPKVLSASRKSTTTTVTATKSKVITPERSPKKRRLFRDKPTTAAAKSSKTTTAAVARSNTETKFVEEMLVPLKGSANDDDDDHLDGIKMLFSGIDENEIALEFSDHVHPPRSYYAAVPPPPPPPPHHAATMFPSAGTSTSARMMTLTSESAIRDTKEISFDYWDALVEGHTR